MKQKNLRKLAVAGLVAGLVGLLAPQTIVQADDVPGFPTGSDAPVYLIDAKTGVDYAAGSSLDWNASQGVFLSATAFSTTPTDYEQARLPYATDSVSATTFISGSGDETTPSKWKAWSDTVPLNGKGVLLPQVTPAYQAYGFGADDGASTSTTSPASLAQAVVKANGGTVSLGVAYRKADGTVSKAYFTSITVNTTAGTFTFATPGVNKLGSTTALTSSPASPVFGAEVTLTATVSPSAASGSVDFYEGTTKLGSGTLASGVATFKTSTLAVGSHTLKATYVGDDTYATSTSANATVTVAGAAFTAATPTISGTVKAGSTVTAVPGTWTPAPTTTTYKWLLNGTTTLGTSSTLKVKPEWGGGKLSVSVTGSKSGYTTVTKTSAAATVPKSAFTKSSTPTISGTAKVGKTLTAKTGSWSPTPTFTYQWYANGKAIKAATKSSYKIVKTYKGKKITVKVTGAKTGYTSKSVTSKATKKVAK